MLDWLLTNIGHLDVRCFEIFLDPPDYPKKLMSCADAPSIMGTIKNCQELGLIFLIRCRVLLCKIKLRPLSYWSYPLRRQPRSIIELTLAFSQPKVKNNFNSPIFLQQMWKCKYVETSAKEGTNVNELFEELLKLETSRTLRWSTCPLVYFTWLLDHVTYLKLRNNLLLLQAEQFHKMTTVFTQNFTQDHFE